MDTSCYTHLCRAGHSQIIKELAPGGVVLVPTYVHEEIESGREDHYGIPSTSSVDWARIAVLSDAEMAVTLELKAEMGGAPLQHLGECAVIACASARGLIAVLDERVAKRHAEERGVPTIDTLWIVVEAYRTLDGWDRGRVEAVVDDLVGTGMWLPITDGKSLIAWAWEEGLLT